MKLFYLLFFLPVLSFGQWQGNSTLQYFNGGNVGIGTSSPINILDVNGVGRFRRQGSATAGLTIGGDALSLYGWGANNPYIQWTNSNGTRQGYMGWNTNRLSLILENGFNYTVENGNMGVGTSSPTVRLEVNGDIKVGSDAESITGYGAKLQMLGASLNGDNLWLSRYNNGSNQSELRVNIGDDYGQNEDMFVVGTHHWNGGTWYPHLAVQASGRVGIGTTSPDAQLAVKGTIHSQEVKVDMIGWSDYVFDKDYDLPSLEEVKKFIAQNHHLPEVPSAKEVDESGLMLGEMNKLLVTKLEEMTLYIIEMKEQISRQQEEIEKLKSEMK